MTCRHPHGALFLERESDSCPDGYGGTDTWSWTNLKCNKCGKKLKVYDENQRHGVDKQQYTELTGRAVDLKELQKLFQTNRPVYLHLNISAEMNDAVLRTVGKRTDALEKAIQRKKKSIQKQIKQLESMVADYDGHNMRSWSIVNLLGL